MDTTETITARFEVTGWDPEPLAGLDGDWVGAIVMRKRYTEGLFGESVAHFVSSGTEEGGRGYLAAERVTGTLPDGRNGSFTVHHGRCSIPTTPRPSGTSSRAPAPGTSPRSGARRASCMTSAARSSCSRSRAEHPRPRPARAVPSVS